MKIKELQVYQAVKFQKKHETFFSSALKDMSDVDMEVISWGIKIKTPRDEAIISFNNIAYAKPFQTEEPKAEQQKAKKA